MHPTMDCLNQAIRRRAFARGLRVAAEVDLGELTAAVRTAQVEYELQGVAAKGAADDRRKRVQR